jgi:hypothetical protein
MRQIFILMLAFGVCLITGCGQTADDTIKPPNEMIIPATETVTALGDTLIASTITPAEAQSGVFSGVFSETDCARP